MNLVGKAIVLCQNPIRIDDDNEPEPDFAVAKLVDNFYADAHPNAEALFLVIEVAKSSLETDQEIKAKLYALKLIPEYWIINLVQNQIEIYSQPQDGVYQSKQIISTNGKVQCNSMPFALNYSDIFPDS